MSTGAGALRLLAAGVRRAPLARGPCLLRSPPLASRLAWDQLQSVPASRSFASEASAASDIERAVSEQQQVLFPRLQELEQAAMQEDISRRQPSAPPEQWSPKQLPYKVFERDSSPAGQESDDDSESDGEEEAPATAMEAQGDDVAGLQVGLDESLEHGFRYSGPEPTLYGDWAHKGRVTDF